MDNAFLDGFYLGSVRIEPLTGEIRLADGSAHIPSRSVEVLLCLANRPRRLVTREEILEKVWGDRQGSAEALNNAISELRHALGDDAARPRFIQTVPKRGYRLLVEPSLEGTKTDTAISSADTPQFLGTLVRRGVLQALAAYLVTGWVLVQVADVTFGNIGLPPWTAPFITYVVIGGIPLVIIISWFLDFAEGRMVRDRGQHSASWWQGLGRNYLAILTALGFSTIGAGIYQLTVGFAPPIAITQVAPQGESDTTDLIPIEENSIAVLRLLNVDGSDTTQVFSNGLSEDILDRLARVPGLLVSSRGDSWSLPDNASSDIVRRRLRVAYFVEGSVRLIDGNITVIAQLIDSRTRFHVTSRTITRNIAKFAEIQEEITSIIVSELRVALPENFQSTWTASKQDSNVDTYMEYRRGKDILNEPRTAESIRMAAEHFRAALEIDDAYAAAHAGLCIAATASYQLDPDPAYMASAEEACATAVNTGPHLPLVYRATGSLYYLTGRIPEAEATYREALTINPQDASAILGLARIHRRQQEYEQAEELITKAIQLQPGNWRAINALATLHLEQGNWSAAVANYEKVVYLNPQNFVVLGNYASAQLMLGNFENARGLLESALEIDKDPRFYSNLGIAYYYLGRFVESVDVHRLAVELSPSSSGTWLFLADALHFAGEDDESQAAFARSQELATRELGVDAMDAEILGYRAWARAMTQDVDSALRDIERALELAPDDMYSHYYKALIELQRDNTDGALGSLELAIRYGFPAKTLAAEPYLKPLHNDDQFLKLL